jgi:flagellar motor component MotA
MGGHFGVLFQPRRVLMIGGSALGAFIAGNNGKTIKATIKELPRLLRSSKHNRQLYMDLLALLYELLAKARKEGMMKLESDVEDPAEQRDLRPLSHHPGDAERDGVHLRLPAPGDQRQHRPLRDRGADGPRDRNHPPRG